MELLSRLTDFLWNPWLLGLFLTTGLVYSAGSGFFQLFEFPVWWRATAGSLFRRPQVGGKGGLSPFQALATALASTIGTGSIAGVASALTLGGPGAVFWMWVSALVGMGTKYVEVVLALRFRKRDGQGLCGGRLKQSGTQCKGNAKNHAERLSADGSGKGAGIWTRRL